MNVPRPGTQFLLPLTERTGDVVTVRVLADVDRDLVPHLPHGVRSPVEVVAGAVLVEVHQDGRPLLPGAWVEARALSSDLLRAAGVEPVLAGDIQMPAVVLGQGTEAVLAWGETVWPLPFDPSVAIPDSCRPGLHGVAHLRRLALIALGRRGDVSLTLWRNPDFEVPWHDVRLVERSRWWFDLAQIPAGASYADVAAMQGVPVERLVPNRGR